MKQKLLFFLLISSSSLLAQLPNSLIEPAPMSPPFEEYEGSIYQNLRFENASVVDEKSGTYDVKLRYNIFTDVLEYKRGDKIFNVIKKPSIHCRIGDDYYYYCDFKTLRGMKKPGYYVLVELNERYGIYKKPTLQFVEPKQKASAFEVIEPGKIRSSIAYFLEEKGVLMSIPMDKKEILVAFDDKKDELKSYMKSEKIKLKKEEDLIRLVSRYNSLKMDTDYPTRSLLSNASQN